MLNFSSDNASGVSSQIMAALNDANAGAAMAYGNDDATAAAQAAIAALFETQCAVYPVATGTIANVLALSTLCPPHGAILCHEMAHIYEDECGAPQMFTGGAKLRPLTGAHAKISAEDLDRVIRGAGLGFVHASQPSVVSITQITELGTAYTLDEVKAIAEVCHSHGLFLHMDGARFANAVVALDCAPADVTWRQGVDVMSFGATKNGAMAAEAVVFFNSDLVRDFEFRRKRAGQLFSKMRFISAQLAAYVADGHWLDNARQANAMAARLSEGLLAQVPGASLFAPVDGNEVFVNLPGQVIETMQNAGVLCHRWADQDTVRLVCSFNTKADAVDRVIEIAAGA